MRNVLLSEIGSILEFGLGSELMTFLIAHFEA